MVMWRIETYLDGDVVHWDLPRWRCGALRFTSMVMWRIEIYLDGDVAH